MRFICLFFIVFYSCLNAQNESITIDVSKDIVIPKHYIVSKTDKEIIIDGKADDSSWSNANFTDKFIDIEGIKKPKYDTKIKMLWDDKYLYVYSKMEEPHIWGNLKQRDTIIFYNNDFEVFIDASGKGENYGEIEINALNTVWDLFLADAYRVNGKANFEWNLNDLKSAVNYNGTINNSIDEDKSWSVEIAIPIKPFLRYTKHNKIIEGEQWRINFSRVQWNHDIIDGKYNRKKTDGKFDKEYNWVWSNQKVINMHEPEKWGFLQFTNSKSSDKIEFNKDEDLMIKQSAYALFRRTIAQDLKYLLDKNTNEKVNIYIVGIDNHQFTTIFTKTNLGFEYVIKDNSSKNIYCINEKGILKKL